MLNYKSTLQSNNTTLNANNIDLQSLIDQANTLPDASGENTDIEDAIVTRTLTEYTNDRVTSIGSYAFAQCFNLTSINFPACTNIENNAFQQCSSLTSVNFSTCINIGANAFSNCTSLTSVSFPGCTAINVNAFSHCSKLTSVNFPVCTYIGTDAFAYCTSLTSINFPACTNIGAWAFDYCSKLASINFPACTNIGDRAFNYCTGLTSVNFPVCTSIGASAFHRCYTLSSLTLEASRICTLLNSNAFTSTPYAGYSSYFSGTPYIYVPATLLTAYQSATNWAYFSSYFKAIGENSDLSGFTISDITEEIIAYQVEEGMTWAEWCNSEYNTDGYYADDYQNIVLDTVMMGQTIQKYLYLDDMGEHQCVSNETIIADSTYYLL